MQNIIFVDSSVKDYETIVNSVNSETLPIVYDLNTSKTKVLNTLTNNFTYIKNIAVCCYTESMFLDGESFFTDTNTSFMINVIKNFNVENIHYLACNSLKDPRWVDYYNIIKNTTNIVVGASNDFTGNINYGGNWEMENISTDVENIYFSENIRVYTYLLDLSNHTVVIMTDGTAYSCGYNNIGQLGDGTTTDKNTLTLMTLPSGKLAKSVSIGVFHTVVIMTDGTAYSCGGNNYGQLGDGTTSRNVLTLMTLPSGKLAKSVSNGAYHTIVIMTDGTVYGCGRNNIGQLGDGTTTSRNVLTLMTLPSGKLAKSVSGGDSHTVVIMTDGTAYSCGNNAYGQLGDGTTTSRNVLTLMTLPSGKLAESVFGGAYHTIVIMTDGTAYSCGYNIIGQLGDGTTTNRNVLTLMTLPSGKLAKSVFGGAFHTVVIMTDGTAYSCGYNNIGQLGDGTTTSRNVLTLMTLPSGKLAKSVSGGVFHTVVIMTDGTVYACGDNISGQLGDGTTTSRNVLTNIYVVPTITNFSISPKIFGDVPFTITTHPTSNSAGSFSYTSSNLLVATIFENIITIIGAGSVTITATQASSTIYTSGTITTTFQVNPATPTITNFNIRSKIFGERPFTIISPTSNSNGSFSYTSSDLLVATISENTITFVGAGSATITATQSSTTNYTSGTITTTLVVIPSTPVSSREELLDVIDSTSTYIRITDSIDLNGSITPLSSKVLITTGEDVKITNFSFP
jgi:alpha-tubulin suppressor-like RCC1 family protein